MQISDASSIASFIPSRAPQQLKASEQLKIPEQLKVTQATTSPQSLSTGAQSQIDPKPTVNNVSPPAISSPPVPDLGPTLPIDGTHVETSTSNPLKALLADWGKNDSPYDLDGDGTVGISDMLELLKRMAETPLHKEPDPLQALLDDWGKSDSPHDLDGDGTVGIRDMLMLLKQMAEPPAQDETNPLQALLADWGKADSQYDLDGNGTVGIRDMLMMLKRMAQGGPEPSLPAPHEPNDREHFSRIRHHAAHHRLAAENHHREPESSRASRPEPNDREHFDRIGRHAAQHHRAAAQYHRAAAQSYARSILPQLASMDPDEVRESIKDSKVPVEQKQFVLDQIAARHPRGHHVSVVG